MLYDGEKGFLKKIKEENMSLKKGLWQDRVKTGHRTI